MSGDVQPRKRKDKKRKKDELGVEEPRGTAAVFGEGDVFMHSQHEHGTGGHWCAKVIFFSLLAVLVTLIGLIILENRGLSDLEANSVESRYSGVLEGWIEDAPHDGHHDEHTLELKHDDVGGHDDDDEPSQEIDQDDEEDHEDEHEDADDHDDEVDQDVDQSEEDDHEDDSDANDSGEDDDNSEEQNLEDADEEDYEEPAYKRYVRSAEYQQGDDDDDDEDDDDDLQKVDENDSTEDNDENDQDEEKDESLEQDDDNDRSMEEIDDDNEQSAEEGDNDEDRTVGADNGNYDDDDNDGNDSDNDAESKEDGDNSNEDENDTREDEDEEEHDDDEGDLGVEVEKLEKEISDEDALSTEEPEQPESKEDDRNQEDSNEATPDDVDDEEEYLELDDIDEPPPVVEHIKVPAGKPLAEVEEDATSEKPQDTLAEEEEYEKQQEELRREKAEASHMWLKLVVGGALLAATHAVVRRATAPRDAPDDHAIREETPAIDRRMTLIPEEAAAPATPTEVLEEPEIEEEILENISSVIQSALVEPESEEDDDEDIEEIEIESKEVTEPVKDTVDKELYSDEEEYDDEDEEEEIIVEKNEPPKQSAPVTQKAVASEPEPEPEEEVPDDVEIMEDEPLEEELGEEEEEDDISDVDDAELLSRLEAKYGRLPDPERPGQKHKDGGNSIEDDWPGEPSDAYWRQQLDQAEQELRQGEWSSAERRVSAAALGGSARGRWLAARALDAAAEARRDNALLSRAIAAYLDLLKMNDRLSDNILHQITNRTLDRIRFRGSYLTAEPVYRLLIRRFPDVPDYHNNLTITYLMANRADLAEESIKETLKRWPDDRVALAHYGFVLKTQHNRLEEAVDAFQKALKDDVGPATEPRFYYHLGDSLLLLGRFAEAHEVHKRGAALGHFLSPAQRSLYNVDRLKSRPWWTIEQTPYSKLARALEKSWKEILKEGEAARALYEKEKEGLKERGEWSQLDLFVRGQEVPERCKRAPVTCSIVRSEPAAIGCRRGQVKFSSMEAGTHVRPHVGPTNCRLRMHLGLSNTKDTYIRVDQETRQWQAGKVLMFDDSFEHEVWHNGTGARLVLIVDVWHPDLTPAERRALPAI